MASSSILADSGVEVARTLVWTKAVMLLSRGAALSRRGLLWIDVTDSVHMQKVNFLEASGFFPNCLHTAHSSNRSRVPPDTDNILLTTPDHQVPRLQILLCLYLLHLHSLLLTRSTLIWHISLVSSVIQIKMMIRSNSSAGKMFLYLEKMAKFCLLQTKTYGWLYWPIGRS